MEIRDTRPGDSARARKAIRRWHIVLGSSKILTERLNGSAFPLPVLQGILGGLQGQVDIPSWAVTLREVFRSQAGRDSLPRRNGVVHDRSFSRHAPLPFQELLIEFLRHARERLQHRAGPALGVLRMPAVASLERHLLAHLTFVASLTVGRHYYLYRLDRAPLSAFATTWRHQAASSRIYRAFVRDMRDGGLAELLESYPVLARLLSQGVEQWIDAVADFCIRFVEDFPELRRVFAWKIDGPVAAVVQLQVDLSDRHCGGRTVFACRIKNGEDVVYKPRTVRPEQAFYRFIDWLNDRDLSLKLRSLRMLDRATHGWVEAVAVGPCRTTREVHAFYRRAGMLIAALHMLATTDIHRDNLIASGEHPVIVDLETILNGGIRASRDSRRKRRVDDVATARPSVMSTGMLPFWPRAADDDEPDMSALGSDSTQDPQIRPAEWDAVNTDQMTMSKGPARTPSMTHRVQLKKAYPSAVEYLSSILDGFRETYGCLLRSRDRLLADSQLLDAFDGLNLRILVRSTVTYTRLQLHSLHPEFLQDGLDRSIELEWLARPMGPRAFQEGPRRLYECERTAMEQLDVPRLTTRDWAGMDQSFEDEEMRRLFKPRDSRVLVQRLIGQSDADCRRQLSIIERAVRSRFNQRPSPVHRVSRHKGERGRPR